MTKLEIERAYNEIVNSGYGFNQCHESTMRTAASVLKSALEWNDLGEDETLSRYGFVNTPRGFAKWATLRGLENTEFCFDDGVEERFEPYLPPQYDSTDNILIFK